LVEDIEFEVAARRKRTGAKPLVLRLSWPRTLFETDEDQEVACAGLSCDEQDGAP
jgi:hypothetical protein